MNWKKWISIAAAVCLAVTAVPMRAVAQEEFVQEKMLEEIKEEIKEELKEEKEEQKEEKEELKEEKEDLTEEKEEKEEKEKLQEQSDEKTEPQEESKKELPKGISLLMEEENSTVVSGNETADFEGAGTAESPYLIEDVEDLKKLAEKVNGGVTYAGKHFKLTANIDLNNEPNWTPIGKSGLPFQGTFDGDGYQIANLKITGGSYAGLFGYTKGADANAVAVIQNCNVTGEINGYNHTGGIVGDAGINTKILNCSFQGNVEGNGENRGGIVGDTSSGCEVSGCFVTGTVTGGSAVGGIAGWGVGTIKNCYALADVTAAGYNAGGIAGYYCSNFTIENCYYSGNVSASKCAGGIAGTALGGTIQNCVSLAESVTGSNANRIAGYKNGETLTANYAWGGTTINGNSVSDNDAGGVNGANLTYTGGTLSEQFSEIFKNDSAWKFTEDGLPILKDVGGTQSAYLPPYLTGEGFYGKGTAENPYEIRNVNDLKLLAEKVNSGTDYAGKYFKQTANIDLSNETNWTPIGTMLVEEVRPFQGTFDGDEHQITNLKISNGGQYAGLFGYTEGAVIKSCNVTGKINGYNYTGGIVGYANANTKILNCSFQGNVKGKGEGRGGIVGYMSGGGEVSGCFVTGTVTGDREVGGIAGYGVGTIKNCYALANVTATATATATGVIAGGIAGYAYGVTIENCYYSGEVSAKNYAGGIAGTAWRGTIQNCVSLAESVSGSDLVNRIVGYVGSNANVTLTNNYSYNRTKLVINGKITYADTDNADTAVGKNVFVSAGRVMTDVPNQTLFNWVENGFTKANGWSIPTEAGKLPSLREGEYPNLPDLPEEPVPTKKRSSSSGTTTQTYTAQFDTNGGSAVDKVKTDKNGKIERPADPTKEGYIFVGWYSDSKLTKPFDFSAELTANSTLYAKWKENNEIILTIGSRKISVFGREIKNDVAPKIVNDRTMLPIRIVAESLGGTVTWNGELQRVTIQKGADVILITIGADTAYVNGTAVKLDAAAFVENGRTYLPLRFVSETLGAQVAWKEAEKTVTITK